MRALGTPGASSSSVAFTTLAATLALGSVVAFWRPYFSRPASVTEPYVHAHVFLVALWMAALIGQPLLLRARRLDLHRTVGRLSLALAPLVAISALLLAHSRFARMDAATLAGALVSLYLPLMATTAFAVSYALAVVFRRRWVVHAVFMAGTAFALVDPIVVRLVFFYTSAGEHHWIYDVIGTALVGTLLAVLMVVFRRVPHATAALVGLLVLFGTLSAGWFTLARTSAWATFARWFVGLPLT